MKKILALTFIVFTTSCVKIWNYDGVLGAKHWGDLKEEFKFCKIGYNQSPIDIKSEFQNEDLKLFYSLADVEKKRAAYNLQVEFDSHDFLMRGKKKYLVRHFEFHHPSEHLVNGSAHSLELQIYHKSNDEQWLTLAIFLEVGKENPAFNQLIEFLRAKKTEAKIDLSKIVKDGDKMFFYDGSFTTPPCLEGVKWYAMKTPIEISKEQMNQIIKSAIFAKANARPVQEFHFEKY